MFFTYLLFARVQNEYKLLKQAMSNYIVLVHGWVKWPKSVGLVMEYMPGGDLTQFLSTNLEIPFMRFFLRVFYELSAALAFIHDDSTHKRVVHGDLKPENVLLTSDLHCKLSDFGSAQMVAIAGFTTSHGASQNKLDMTLAYAPPEKLKSLNIKPTKEHDTYSFGMMLYAILSGSLPYQRPSHERAFRESIIGGERPDEESIDELKATLPEHQQQILDVLRSMMRRCWAQDPSDRPTMLEVRDELKSLLEQQSEEAIAGEVSEMLEVVQVNIPNKEEHHFQPLHEFSPKTGKFEQGKVSNVLNFPTFNESTEWPQRELNLCITDKSTKC